MKKKQKLFLGFVVIVIAAIFTGCISMEPATFSSDFTGTWERAGLEYPHTLTFTSRTVKASNQTSYWNLRSVSGDTYIISNSNSSDLRGTIRLKLVGNSLEIVDAYDMSNVSTWSGGEDDWTGTWKRK
jgi:hypothetical protein